jgi:outer membrane protein OmpA-like peptidoglycan-associated protein
MSISLFRGDRRHLHLHRHLTVQTPAQRSAPRPSRKLLAVRSALARPWPRRTGLSASVLSIVVAIGSLGTLAACSAMPERNAALDAAQARYATLSSQGPAQALAPDELQRANVALRRAEQARTDGQDSVAVDHLAYLANQQLSLVQDTANSRAAQAVTTGAAAERDRMRLAQRTQEADMAQGQLAASQQQNANTSQQLASSQQQNADTRQQLAGAQQRNASQTAQMGDMQAQLQAQWQALNAKQTERGIVITLGDLLFATGQSQLQGDGERAVGKLADFLKRNPERHAAIEGYTDSVGGEAANQALSDRRAQAVVAALVSRGVPPASLQSAGYGETRPVAPNTTVGGRQQNRRVEVVFAPMAGDALVK